jgi:hypothetical protein
VFSCARRGPVTARCSREVALAVTAADRDSTLPGRRAGCQKWFGVMGGAVNRVGLVCALSSQAAGAGRVVCRRLSGGSRTVSQGVAVLSGSAAFARVARVTRVAGLRCTAPAPALRPLPVHTAPPRVEPPSEGELAEPDRSREVVQACLQAETFSQAEELQDRLLGRSSQATPP